MDVHSLGELATPVAALLSSLTPEQIKAALAKLTLARPERLRSGVTASELVEALLGSLSQASGPAAWRARLLVRAAVQELVAGIPGMKYVEGDA